MIRFWLARWRILRGLKAKIFRMAMMKGIRR
jgi:hypothetical protein